MTNQKKGFGKRPKHVSDVVKMRQMRKRIASDIERTGRSVLAVLPEGKRLEECEADEGNNPAAFTYTIGNHLHHDPYPELLTFYPSNPTNRFLLNHLSDALRDGEIDLKPGEAKEVAGFLGQHGEIPVRLRYLTTVEQAYSNTKYTIQLPADAPVVLVEPPTPRGDFAEDEGCDQSVRQWYERVELRVTEGMIRG